MGNSGWTADPNTITIPASAGPTDPRIVITGDAPSEIGYPVDAAILFYFNGTDYFYIGVSTATPNQPAFTRGFVSASTGDSDLFEEIFYDQTARQLTWQRYVADYAGGVNYALEYMRPTLWEMSTPGGLILLNAGQYKINGEDVTAGEGEDWGQAAKDVELTNVAVGGIAAVETVVHTLTYDAAHANRYQTNRRYELTFTGRIRSTIASDRVQLRIRQDNATGTIERDCGHIVLPVANTDWPVDVRCLYTGRLLNGETIVLTAVRTGGTGTITYTPDAAWSRDLVSTNMT